MLKFGKIIFLLIVSFFIRESLFAAVQDSIGIEKKDGKVFILHEVEAKETLYSISKKYSVKIEEIKSANTDLTAELKIGQTLRIPKGTVSANSANASSSKQHTVEKKETFYSISKLYNISVETLIKANPALENGLKEGQVINIPVNPPDNPSPEIISSSSGKVHLVEAKETLFGISKKYDVSVDEIKKANPALIDGLKIGMELIIPEQDKESSNDSATKPKNNDMETKEESNSTSTQIQTKGDFKKITEKGYAELLEAASDSPKFQAHHKTAPVGTIIQVLNESNGQKIFVRVVGKLNSADTKTVIKISQKATERLEIKDKKTPVTLIYIP